MLKSLTLVSLLLSSTAYAAELEQDAPRPDAAAAATPARTGDKIIVTATRVVTTLDEVPASVTVLDKAAIDRAQDIGVAELLLRTPGVTISRNGGYGTATSLRIRGAEGDQTVVVIDGVKINDPSVTGGGFNFGNLLAGDAARIEVLRGPQSTLWGSQAIGGVVNIVTAQPEKDLEGSFDVEAGSRETVNARAAVGGRTGPVAWRIGGQTFTTQGISALTKEFGGGERDGYTNRNVAGRLDITVADGVSLDLRSYYAVGRVESDGFAGDSPEYSTNREFVGYAGLNIALFDGRLRNRFAYGYTDTDRENFDPRRERKTTFDAIGRNERLEYQGSFAISEGWNLLFGAENEKSRFRSVAPAASLSIPVPAPSRGKAELTSFYGQLSAQPFAGLTLTGGVRHDDHNRFGGKTLFSAGGIWVLPTNTVVRASYGEGFKAPTLYQLFSEYGNMDLGPEVSHGWEAGVEQRLWDGRFSVGAVYFERNTRGQIDYYGCSGASVEPLCFIPGTTTPRYGYYDNIAHTKARGIEAQAAFRPVEGLQIDGNYSWIAAENDAEGTADFGNWLPRRPRHSANGSISYDWAFGLTTGVAVRWAGHSFDNMSNSQRLGGYTLVDLRAEVPVTPEVKLFARAENIFDEDYMTAYRFGTLGRSIFVGLRGRF